MEEFSAMHHLTRHHQKDNNDPPESSLVISNGIDGDTGSPKESLIRSLLYCRSLSWYVWIGLFPFVSFVASEVFCLVKLINNAQKFNERKPFIIAGITIAIAMLYIGWVNLFQRFRIHRNLFTYLMALNCLNLFTILILPNGGWEVYCWLILVSKTGSHVMLLKSLAFYRERQC